MNGQNFLTIAEAARKLRAGDVTSRGLVTESLERIQATQGNLHSAITIMTEEAISAAAKADSELQSGKDLGPLHGIPIGLKDIYNTAGVRTTCHSRMLEDHVPNKDAASVARLRAAGAVFVAKLATHEFAFGGPSFDLPWPPARNPWNTDHVPGGSSSGSGAAVAAGLVMGAMGSDTGGSIRSPAGVNGIVGLKPSYGSISRRGIFPLSWTQDHAGPMTRTVEDCAIMLQVLARYDPEDPASVDTPIPDYLASLSAPIEGLKVGLVRDWYARDGLADEETIAVVDDAAASLSEAGLEVREITLPESADYTACGRIIILSEAFAIHRSGLLATPERYGAFFRDRARLGAFIASHDYIGAMRMRRWLTEATYTAMADAEVDILLTANQYGPAERFSNDSPTFPFNGKPYLTMPFNVTGQPALTVCGGFAANGLPLGVQLAGKPYEDDVLLRVGHAFEAVRGDLGRTPSL